MVDLISLVVQGLRLLASIAMGMGTIPGWVTMCHIVQSKNKTNKIKMLGPPK